ncbi:MAG: inorganic phosphate transporter [Chloroflexi bacterium]|nr:inorganic phosphate transporter [Chloroflexota bacterium]
MPDLSLPLLVVLFLVLAAEFVNGWTDAPNAIATVVSTRVLSPLQAVVMAVALNMAGALITGTAVATTISKGILKPEALDLTVVAAAMLAIVIWSTITWRYGLPTSESHALIASLTGAGLVAAGPSVLLAEGWTKVLIGLLFSTFLGFFLSVLLMTALLWLLQRASPATAGGLFSRLQLVSSAVMAFSHGSNDGQKFMGAFALALFLGGAIGQAEVPLWVIWLCGAVMGLGTAFGGWRILRTMGFRLTKLEPVHGFAAESSASFSILLASHLGIPLSTTHTINTSIMGVGATQRLSAVRWGVTRNIVAAWLLTFPVCGILAAILAVVLRLVF